MPKYMTLAPHPTNEELAKRYRKARAGVDRSQWQIIWLLVQGKHSGEVAAITGYRVGWIRALVRATMWAGQSGSAISATTIQARGDC
jgi:hypothetical protein